MAKSTLSICYLLEDTALFGGVKVLLHQANLLARRGHRVILAAKGSKPDWYELEAELVEVAEHRPGLVPAADVTVATFWTTLRCAGELEGTEVVHYCQGYEGLHTHNRADHREIERLYGEPLPAMVVSSHLTRMLETRYRRPSRMAPPPLSAQFRPLLGRRFAHAFGKRAPSKPARVLVVAPWEMYLKGVPVAVQAVRQLRQQGLAVELVRLSQWPLTDEERAVMEPDEFHHRLPPDEVPRLLASCDLLLAPSWEAEGFGLPALEAMGCGVPVVTSDVSCYRSWAGEAAIRVEGEDAGELARVAGALLTRPKLWRRQRDAGLRRAQSFREDLAADQAERALRWVASGAWRQELEELRDARRTS